MRSWSPAIALLLAACATAPTGPSVMVLPGSEKPFEQFQADDTICRQWAARQTETMQSADISGQRRYDMSYMQCMYGKGHQIPGAGGSPPRPVSSTPNPTATDPVPDIRGTWRGTWAATPLTLLILSQEETPVPGMFGVSGILTFSVRDEAISVNVQGRFGDANGRRTLVLDPQSGYGQQITLTRVDPDYMAGVGTSRANWEPSGPVELVRQSSGVSP